MAVSDFDEATGPDVGLGMFNLNPGFGLNPGRAVQLVGSTSQAVYPDPTGDLISPLSVTQTPRGAAEKPIMAVPGQPVNLLPQTANLIQTPQVAPVVPQGSVALTTRSLVQPDVQPDVQSDVQPPVRTAQALPPAPAPTVGPPLTKGQPYVPGQPVGPFGSQLPPKTAYDPNANPLLKQREDNNNAISEALKTSNSGLINVLNKSEADAARAKLQELYKDKERIDQALQVQQTNQQAAANAHARTPLSATADGAAVQQNMIKEWREGNFWARRALVAQGLEGIAAAQDSEGYAALNKDVTAAGKMFSKIDDAAAANDLVYKQKRDEVLKEAQKNIAFRDFGLTEDKIPLTRAEYNKNRGLIQAPMSDASKMVANFQRIQANQAVPKPVMDEKFAQAITSDSTHKGMDPGHYQAVTLEDLGNQTGTLLKDSTANIKDYTRNGPWTSWDTAEKNAGTKMLESPELKGVLNQHKLAVRFQGIVNNDRNFQTAGGQTLISDALGGVFRDMAEASQASGNVGLSKQLDLKMGWVERHMNEFYTNWSAYKQWLLSDQSGTKPKLEARPDARWSAQTIAGIKEIGQFNLEETTGQLPRLAGVADYVGKHAGKLQDIGISDAAAEALKPYLDAGEQKQRFLMDTRDALIRDGRRIELPRGTRIDPSTPGYVPAGSYSKSLAVIQNQKTTAPPVAPNVPSAPTPSSGGVAVPGVPVPAGPGTFVRPEGGGVPGAVTPAVPQPPAPVGRRSDVPGAGGGGVLASALGISPAQAADQPPPPPGGPIKPPGTPVPAGTPGAVAGGPYGTWIMPPAAQPAASGAASLGGASYDAGIRAGESSNNYAKPPGSKSTASGAYQMIDETWIRNRPPDATAAHAYQATPAQQDAAHQKFTAKNAMALQAGGVPVNTLTLAMAHQQGAGGAQALLNAPDSDIALNYVNRKAAANNKDFFWKADGSQMTVAETKAKMAQFYRTGGEAAQPAQLAGTKPFPNPQTDAEYVANIKAGFPLTDAERAANVKQAKRSAIGVIPAATGTAGVIGGTIAGGPPGGLAGSVVGTTAGKLIEERLLREEQDRNYPAATVGGVVQGIGGGIPGGGALSTIGRVATMGAGGGVEEYMRGGSNAEVFNAATGSAIGAGLGEAVGAAVGSALTKTAGLAYTKLSGADQVAAQNAAKILAEQHPQTMLANGTTVENKTYTAAHNFLTGSGIDPEKAVHGYNTAIKEPTTVGQAMATRPGQIARAREGANLEDIKNRIGAASATNATPAATQKLVNSIETPHAIVGTPDVPDTQIFRDAANKAAIDMRGRTPATNFGEVWGNLAEARKNLLVKERETLLAMKVNPTPGQKEAADAYRAMADHVREQQGKIAKELMPPRQATQVLEHLDNVDVRYRNAVKAGGRDIVETIAKGGAEGAQAKTAFEAFAGNDPAAKRWVNSLVAAHGTTLKGDTLKVIATAAGGLAAFPLVHPVAGYVLGAISVEAARRAITNYMTQKAAGKMVRFQDVVMPDLQPISQLSRQTGSAFGRAGGEAFARYLVEPSQQPQPVE